MLISDCDIKYRTISVRPYCDAYINGVTLNITM